MLHKGTCAEWHDFVVGKRRPANMKRCGGWGWFEQSRVADESIVTPVIPLSEVAAALRQGIGDHKLAQRVVQQLARSEVIELIPVTQPMAEQAAVIVAEHRIRGCDAIYVALTDQFSDTLVTRDRLQLERGRPL